MNARDRARRALLSARTATPATDGPQRPPQTLQEPHRATTPAMIDAGRRVAAAQQLRAVLAAVDAGSPVADSTHERALARRIEGAVIALEAADARRRTA